MEAEIMTLPPSGYVALAKRHLRDLGTECMPAQVKLMFRELFGYELTDEEAMSLMTDCPATLKFDATPDLVLERDLIEKSFHGEELREEDLHRIGVYGDIIVKLLMAGLLLKIRENRYKVVPKEWR